MGGVITKVLVKFDEILTHWMYGRFCTDDYL